MTLKEATYITENVEMTSRAAFALIAIARYSNRHNQSFPSLTTLSKIMNTSTKTAQRGIADLIGYGIIMKNQKRTAMGEFSTLNFTIINPLNPDDEINQSQTVLRSDPDCLTVTTKLSYGGQTASADNYCAESPKNDGEVSILKLVSLTSESTPAVREQISLSSSAQDTAPAHEAAGTTANVSQSVSLIRENEANTVAAARVANDYIGENPEMSSHIGKIHTEKEEKGAVLRQENAAFPLEQLLRQCRLDIFARTLGADKAAEIRSTLTEIYFADELRLFKQQVPRSEFFPSLRYLDYKLLYDAYRRVDSRPPQSIRDRAAYFSATIFNAVKNFGKPKLRRRKAAALAPSVPDTAEIARLEQLLKRQKLNLA
jgi:hypothetical protein